MNQVTNFMYYMFNRWSRDESIVVFGDDLGDHVYRKYLDSRGCGADILSWYAELDRTCKQRLVDRANELYAQ